MDLLLDLSRLRAGTETVDRRFEPGALQRPSDDFAIVAPVHLQAEARKDAEKTRLVGRVTATLEVPCSRCLEPWSLPIDAHFDLLFLPAASGAGEDGQQVTDDDVGVTFYQDETIDLGDVLREQFYLALPMKPLCREDCRGLCPTCGVNRNHETCTCQTEWIDPRLDVLKQFRKV
jgi:uncharacterized protein